MAPVAQADPGVVVSPGMEIHQDSNVCTLGYVDPVQRVAFSAGHCRGSGPVTDKDGRFIGMVSTFRDNTPDGTVVRTDEVISDYETIGLATDVVVNNILPGGRQLVADVAPPLTAGAPVCHFGVVTGESCGSVERVNNGWFTMDNGVVSKKGDSGGPVYVLADSNKAVIIGLFNSTWGALPAAVSWQATGQQVREDVGVVNVAVSQHN
ncbi:S1 family peptidase [Mycolicibacterium litorale]|uniref:S1 family peptidase n=1 Tax=Candidatus Mycolicibacterium alkanivorans TaxID=2954114 RepID=A0ABS9YY51_9MYCO|nr:S1 family peptidase [Candidatus Mycolicibacterium alkanivorans]MCI4675678.1 S1 family peptidase [Candidatus Mycolicibacterium alkanivorans]